MAITVHCPRCGKPLKAPPEMMGRRVKCASCDHEFTLATEALDASSLSSLNEPAGSRRPVAPRDDTLSRSMLPVRGAAAVPPDEMLCRLEPKSLRWLNISEAVEGFLGRSIEQ